MRPLLALLLSLNEGPLTAPTPAEPAAQPADDDDDDDRKDDKAAPLLDTGIDPFAEDVAPTSFTVRSLTQVRLANTWAVRDSLARAGDLSPVNGVPADAEEAAGIARAQRYVVEKPDGFRLQRAFVRMLARPAADVQAKLMVDLAEFVGKKPKRALKQAYVDMNVARRLHVFAGVFKRPFSLLELLAVAEFELAEMGPTDDLLKALGFAGRDTGVALQLRPLAKKKWLTLLLGTFAGDVEQFWDASPVKLLTARAETKIKKRLRFGLDAAWRPFQNLEYYDKATISTPGAAVLDKGWATSADVTLRLGGFETRAEGILGTRTDIDDPYYPLQVRRGQARGFLAAWILGVYHFRWGNRLVSPALRLEWLDGDRQRAGGGLLYASAGLTVGFTRHIRGLLDLSGQNAQRDSRGYDDVPKLSDKTNFYPNLVDFVRLTLQLQVVL
jgi:hypothetical protein